MRVRTDDELYRAKLKYLGPAGYTFPIHLTYAQWGVFAAICFVLSILGLIAFQTPKVLGATLALSIVATWKIFQHVDADVPARKVVKAAIVDARKMGAPDETRVDRIRVSHIRFRPEITDKEVPRS